MNRNSLRQEIQFAFLQKLTDLDGVASVVLLYQVVKPGRYIRKADSQYNKNWEELRMNDVGIEGDIMSGDSIYSAVIPRSVQKHRVLIRYRLYVSDSKGNAVTVPYSDDEQSNFAYFCYNGVPAWAGSNRINGKNETFSSEVMQSLPTYHLMPRVRM